MCADMFTDMFTGMFADMFTDMFTDMLTDMLTDMRVSESNKKMLHNTNIQTGFFAVPWLSSPTVKHVNPSKWGPRCQQPG